MKAILCTAYGPPDVLKLVQLDKPAPDENEILIKIQASTVTLGDCELRNLTLPLWTRVPARVVMGYTKPRHFVPGMELAGIVEAAGKKVKAFKEGDAVFCSSGIRMGGNAEYICRSEKAPIAIKPAGLTFEDAATIIVGGINALHFLRKADIRPGQRVLIIGAGGSIGTFGVQLAKLFGAEVTAVDHTTKLEMLKSIGADHVIDYTVEDFSTNGIRYDVIFDVIYSSSFINCMTSLKDSGCYLMVNTDPTRMLRGAWVARTTHKKVIFAFAAENVPDLDYLAHLVTSGKIKPVIDKVYPLEKVAEAHAYVENNEKKGCVVIRH